ncbi:hypothetical protein OsJ_04529 [Oryza sativa Japonica Group]|uniref:Uncharacterized protein n=1 Tax=Oryza sativa subsp. japonica TaxID=39947 RepID=B9EVU8_ORYSJ|nr:hypothetical protein OsJ_04529 [Oryza sativa Japonica Group]
MAVYIRLDDAVRARLRGDAGSSASSGSEHEASACLSGLVQAFLETEGAAAGEDGAGPASKGGEGYDSDDGDGPERAAAAAESVRELLDPPVEEDPFRYAVVVAAVPASVVVAREEAVGRAVRVAADAARRSLRSHGLHVPPWRKTRYMLAKWLGPYKRSTATSPSAAGAMPMPAAAAGMDVKCRAVGFFTPPPAAPAARIK